jgi:gamma-glutamyltranspeptidase/glutathione hydrolase
MRGQQPMLAFQLMGGDMQAQGHAQVLVDMLDLGSNVQAATDMARFHHSQIANELGMESQLYSLVGKELAAMGHRVRSVNSSVMGGFQAILVTPGADPANPANGRYYRAGSDHRKDGQAVGW